MQELRQRNSNIQLYYRKQYKDHNYQHPSDRSMESQSGLNYLISPWSQDSFYTQIKNKIKKGHNKERSKTAYTMVNKKTNNSCKKREATRINTVHLQIESIPVYTQSLSNFCSKILHQRTTPKSSALDEDVCQRLQNIQQKSKPGIMNDKQRIHFRKFSSNKLKINKHKVQVNKTEYNSHILYKKDDHEKISNEQKGYMFFFKNKNCSNVMLRQRMIMKIRNIQK